MALSQASRLLSLNSGMLNDDKYADMKIVCCERVFELHKNMVCIQSKPLAASFNGGFKESEDSTIYLNDDDLDVVTARLGSYTAKILI